MKKIEIRTEEIVIKKKFLEVNSLIKWLEEESAFWAQTGSDTENSEDFRKQSIAKSSEIDSIIYHIAEEAGIKYPF